MKDRIYGDCLINKRGGISHIIDLSDGKNFCAFGQGAHCGTAYYMPTVLVCKCSDIESAKALIKNVGRIKKDRKGEIMDIFEITQSEAEYILECNQWHDPYYNYKYSENFDQRNELVRDRRVVHKDMIDKLMADPENEIYKKIEIRTQDKYDKLFNAFEGNFAPVLENGKYKFPKVDRNKALNDYYRSTLRRYGINKNDPYIITYYYMMFGPRHLYGIHLEDNYICYSYFKNDERIFNKVEIPELMLNKLKTAEKEGRIGEARLRLEKQTVSPVTSKFDDIDFQGESSKPKTSQTDKFKARMLKTAKLQGKLPKEEPELGGAEL